MDLNLKMCWAKLRERYSYLVGTNNLLYKGNSNQWDLYSSIPKCKFITIDGEDNLWMIDTSGLVQFKASNVWTKYHAGVSASNLAVSRSGDPYVIGSGSQIYRGKMGKWELIAED